MCFMGQAGRDAEEMCVKIYNEITAQAEVNDYASHGCLRKDVLEQWNAGFSLLETLVAIVVFAVVITTVGSSLVMAHRINARSEVLMQEQLKVSRAVEGIMASGIPFTNISFDVNEENTNTLAAIRADIQEDYPEVEIILDWGRLDPDDEHMVDKPTKSFYDVTIRSTVSELKDEVCVHTYVRAVEGGDE